MSNQWCANEICEKSCTIEICSKLMAFGYKRKAEGKDEFYYLLFT